MFRLWDKNSFNSITPQLTSSNSRHTSRRHNTSILLMMAPEIALQITPRYSRWCYLKKGRTLRKIKIRITNLLLSHIQTRKRLVKLQKTRYNNSKRVLLRPSPRSRNNSWNRVPHNSHHQWKSKFKMSLICSNNLTMIWLEGTNLTWTHIKLIFRVLRMSDYLLLVTRIITQQNTITRRRILIKWMRVFHHIRGTPRQHLRRCSTRKTISIRLKPRKKNFQASLSHRNRLWVGNIRARIVATHWVLLT